MIKTGVSELRYACYTFVRTIFQIADISNSRFTLSHPSALRVTEVLPTLPLVRIYKPPIPPLSITGLYITADHYVYGSEEVRQSIAVLIGHAYAYGGDVVGRAFEQLGVIESAAVYT